MLTSLLTSFVFLSRPEERYGLPETPLVEGVGPFDMNLSAEGTQAAHELARHAAALRTWNAPLLKRLRHVVLPAGVAPFACFESRGRPVCRHGVFWKRLPLSGCPCMGSQRSAEEWRHAAWMPKIDDDLHALVAVPFNRLTFERLGVLQARLRRL